MDWIDKFRASRKAQPAHQRVDNILATEYARKTIADRGKTSADRAALLDAKITDEIRRRQVSLIVGYVLSVRAR
jgi:hypothetical protein